MNRLALFGRFADDAAADRHTNFLAFRARHQIVAFRVEMKNDGPLRIDQQFKPYPGVPFDDKTYTGDAYPAFGWAACVAAVEVDLDTCETRVLGTTAELRDLVRERRPDELLIAIPSASGDVRERIVEVARVENVPVNTLPALHELISRPAYSALSLGVGLGSLRTITFWYSWLVVRTRNSRNSSAKNAGP